MKVVELVILNTSILFDQHGQLFELCSQNPTIDFKSMSEVPKPDAKTTTFNFLKFVHKIIL